MTSAWNDFNSADDQYGFDTIPKGTLVKVRMTIKPGGYDDHSQGWTGGYATQSETTGSIYLNGFCDLDGIEFVGKVEMEKDQYGEDKNVIRMAITPDRKEYATAMGSTASQPAQQAPASQQQPAAAPTGRPSWAQ